MVNGIPKFKVGDWIKNYEKSGKPLQVMILCSHKYIFTNGYELPYINEGRYRLWSVQDAESGDVVVDGRGRIHLFDNYTNGFYSTYCYCYQEGEKFFPCHQSYCITANKGKVRPASDTEKGILFQEIVNSGYIFDSKKKRLIKLAFRVGDVVRKKSGEGGIFHISLITEKGYFCEYTPLFPIECQDQFEVVEQKKAPLYLTEFEQKLAEILMNREYEGSTETEEDIEKAMAYYGREAKKVAPELLAIIEKEL